MEKNKILKNFINGHSLIRIIYISQNGDRFMSVNTARMLNRIFSSPAWKLLLVAGALAFAACFIVKGRKKVIPIVLCIISVCLYIVTAAISGSAEDLIAHQGGTDPEKITTGKPVFSENTMFSLRIYEPWFYEYLHFTLESDGTLIVQYYDTELGRKQLSDERMEEIRKVFSPEKVNSMDVGRENDMTDGVSRYIILYDHNGNCYQAGADHKSRISDNALCYI